MVSTISRTPTNEPDTQLYASVAKNWIETGSGVPTVTRNSPQAADHVAFYGPVYFSLTGASIKLFGLSKLSPRLVSLGGALLLAASAALLAIALGGRAAPWPWSILLILLTPEVRYGATSGSMETLAVGQLLAGLACMAVAFGPTRRPNWWASAGGVALGLAALTTPRTYPMVLACLAVGAVQFRNDRRGRQVVAVTAAWIAAALGAWAIAHLGSVGAWVRLIVGVMTQEDRDVAVLGGRQWAMTLPRLITPIASVVVAFAAAKLLDRRRQREARHAPAEFALVAAYTGAIAAFVLMDVTFTVGIYFGVPLLVAGLAQPWSQLDIAGRTVTAGRAALLAVLMASAGLTYGRAAATWDARDQSRFVAFLGAHVPPRSAVIGPPYRYFFAVAQVRAAYFTPDLISFADWTRWIAPSTDERAIDRGQPTAAAPAGRFLLWPTDWTVFWDGYECAAGHEVARYVAPPPNWPTLARLLGGNDQGVPDTTLFALPPGCPVGYDPTGSAPNLFRAPSRR